jgi:hypothetical protein
MHHYYEDSMPMIRTARWKLVTHSSREVQHEFCDLTAALVKPAI